jgi:hypothetical protein
MTYVRYKKLKSVNAHVIWRYSSKGSASLGIMILLAGGVLISATAGSWAESLSGYPVQHGWIKNTESLGLIEKAPYLVYPGNPSEIQVIWQLCETKICSLAWGWDTACSLGCVETNEYSSCHQHSCTLCDLTPGKKYYYRITVGGECCNGEFHSAPSSDADKMKFMAYGDPHAFPPEFEQVAGAMVSIYMADSAFHTFVLSVGDLVSDGDKESEWEKFFRYSFTNNRVMRANLAYQSAIGNRDGSGVLFRKYLPYPFVDGCYWSYDYGPAHFTIVDQYVDYDSASTQLQWVETDLATTTKRWRFLCLHEPGWSAGFHPNNLDVQNYIQPLCEQYGVSILFAGHNHYYARALVNGVHHITTGGGGAPLYYTDSWCPYIVTAAKVYNYCKIEIDGDLLMFSAVTPSGAIIDTFTMHYPEAVVEQVSRDHSDPLLDTCSADPNPFAESTEISFSVPNSSYVDLSVYDISGQEVRVLVHGNIKPGTHHVVWDGRGEHGKPVSQGVYFCRLQVDDRGATSKVVLVR